MTFIPGFSRKLADMRSMTPVDLSDIGAQPADVERMIELTAAQMKSPQRTGPMPEGSPWGFIQSVRKAGASMANWCEAILRATQYGQMNRVLRSMPDDVLDEIGVSRSQIPDYARSLIYDQKH